jgi:RHS repeat-associated protein
MVMPGRKYSAGSRYRYGFNGKENDNEIKGEGNEEDYGLRVYDPRTARFFSIDPLGKKFPYWTPYQFSGNSPIRYVDLDGAEIFDPLTKWFMTDAAITITKKPTSAKAKVYATIIGVGNSVQGVVQAPINIIAHPVNSAKGFFRMLNNSPEENAADYAMSMTQYADLPAPLQDYAIGGHYGTDMTMLFAPMKGVFKAKGAGAAMTAETTAAENSGAVTSTKSLPNPYSRFTRFETKYADHAKTLGTSNSLSRTAYYNRAIQLADAAIGGDILGFTSEGNTTFKLNQKTGEFIVINPDGKISSFYRRVQDPIKYLETQKEKYGVKKTK